MSSLKNIVSGRAPLEKFTEVKTFEPDEKLQ